MSTSKPTQKPTPPQALTLADLTITWQTGGRTFSMPGRTVARFLLEAEAECPTGCWDGLFCEDEIGEELAGVAEACKLMATGDLGAGYSEDLIMVAIGSHLSRLANRLKVGAPGDGAWGRMFRVEVVAPATGKAVA